MIEILYFLARNRKCEGEIGLEGYFSCRRVANELQRMGYVPEDIISALNVSLHGQLITADRMNFTSVSFDDSVHISASGFMHVRVLAARIALSGRGCCELIGATQIQVLSNRRLHNPAARAESNSDCVP